MTIPDVIRTILACPRCHGSLTDVGAPAVTGLACVPCGLTFPVRDGIPVLLLDQATPR